MIADEVELRRCLAQWIQKCITLQRRDGATFEAYVEEEKVRVEEIVRVIWSGKYKTEAPFYTAELYPLHVCARKNEQLCAHLLLKFGWPVNERCYISGETALHAACELNNFLMVRLLLDNGADPNATESFSQTPLIVAISRNAHECVRVLTSKRAAVVTAMTGNVVSPGENNNAMACAARNNNVYAIREMIANYSLEELSFESNEPLIAALSSSNYVTSEMLLNYAIEKNCSYLVNHADAHGTTPLMVIGQAYYMPLFRDEKRHVECLNLLLKCGADANAPCGTIRCPALYHAIKNGYSDEYCGALLEHTDLYAMKAEHLDAILYTTAFRGRTEVMKSLCQKKVDLVCTKGFHLIVRTVLSPFVNMEMIDFLLEAGVDVARDDHHSEGYCHFIDHTPDVMLEVLEVLLKAGVAAKNLNILLESQYKLKYLSEEEELLADESAELFLGDAADALWKYGTQTHWNDVVRNIVGFNKLAPRLPSLLHSCRSALRRALMLTGRYPSMCKVDTKQLGLPELLENYVTFCEAN